MQCLAFMCGVIVIAASAAAQPSSGTINLEGVVITDAGVPLPRATVALRFGQRLIRLTNVTTDGQGRFRVAVTDGPIAFAAWAEDYETASLTLPGVPNNAVQIVLRPATPIRGVIRDGRGAAVARARLRLVPAPAPGLNHVWQAVTGPDGSYAINNAGQAKRYRLEVTAPGCAVRALRTLSGREHAAAAGRTDVVGPCR